MRIHDKLAVWFGASIASAVDEEDGAGLFESWACGVAFARDELEEMMDFLVGVKGEGMVGGEVSWHGLAEVGVHSGGVSL